jgi:hypothetical protein
VRSPLICAKNENSELQVRKEGRDMQERIIFMDHIYFYGESDLQIHLNCLFNYELIKL